LSEYNTILNEYNKIMVDLVQMMSPISPSLVWKKPLSLGGRPLKARLHISHTCRKVSCGFVEPLCGSSVRIRLKTRRLNANAPGVSPDSSSSPGAEDQSVISQAYARFVRYMTSYMARLVSWLAYMAERADFRAWNHMIQFAASVAFVALYVWGTYSQPAKGSLRASLDLWLCIIFAGEFLHRLIFNHKDFGSRLRMLTNPMNALDLLSFTPTLFEVLMQQISPGFSLRRFDLRWTKLLRGLRVIRIGLLAAELRTLNLSTKRGGWLAAGTTFRLVQLAATPVLLLFGASAIFQILEHIPFHKAVYFVATTLSTVGFGDVVAKTVFGKAFVVVMIAVGLVLIPVQAALFYNEISARRVIKGTLPDWRGKPFVLLSTRLIEVRAFSDLYAEFQQALGTTTLFPKDTKIVALCNRPSFEFSAFQELHERSLTLVEGSAVSGSDLVTARAEKANAIILLADRFSTDSSHEDLSILFQVWAAKSYTKTVPLFVQTMKQSTVEQIQPFLDPDQDVAVSMEETRFRLIALSASCPGASTLIGNLIRSSTVRPEDARDDTLAGRKWLRQYVDGCEAMLCRAPVQRHLIGIAFNKVAEWLYRTHGHAIIGIIDTHGKIHLNPSEWKLEMGYTLLVVGHSNGTVAVRKALASGFTPHGTYIEISEEYPDSAPEVLSSFESCQQIYEGLPTTESIDIDDIPCIPKYLSETMAPTDGSAFYKRYRQDDDAVQEQVERGYLSEETAVRLAGEAGIASASSQTDTAEVRYQGHFILCGHSESFVQFMRYLRAAEPSKTVEIVILAEEKPEDFTIAQEKYGPVDFIMGSPTHASSLRQAGAQTARALIFLTKGSRDVQTAQGTGSAVEVVRNTREAVLADASALLACYGVGEESGAALTHAVVELLFTTSIEFLQPGLLLKGVNSIYDESSVRKGQPRKSWSMRALQQKEAVSEGLAEWQANPYYAAGRCTVPALMDTFATQGFFTRGLLFEVLGELCGDFSEQTGAMLVQLPLPPGMAGKTFGECFTSLAISKQMIVIGLYRKKLENPATRLSYVMTLPPRSEILQNTDRLFVIRNQANL
jgi:voltage-gated potassium channel Kch